MPDAETFSTVAQLGGTVFTVFMFLSYLIYKNGKSEKAMKGVTDTLDAINKSQQVHTRVLMRIADQHGLNRESDDLMIGR